MTQTFEIIGENTAIISELNHVKELASGLEKIAREKIKNDNLNKSTIPLFRGEPKIYPTALLPSIFRNPKKFLDNDFESKIINFFQNNYGKSSSVLAQLGNMQHYGFPTRLLDWSSEIEIALYFATFFNLSQNGVIYVYVPSLAIDTTSKCFSPLEQFDDSILKPYCSNIYTPHNHEHQNKYWENELEKFNYINSYFSIPWWFLVSKNIFEHEVSKRIKRQKSYFTFHNGYIHHEELCILPEKIIKAYNFNFISQQVCRLIIPANLKKEIAINLLSEGVSSQSLFPEAPIYNEFEYSL